MIRRRVVVSGHVQGVFYRDTCRRLAEAGGVAGWVCNRPDGTVEAVLEGPDADVERLVAWCRQGPRDAVVEKVTVTDESPRGESGFRIR